MKILKWCPITLLAIPLLMAACAAPVETPVSQETTPTKPAPATSTPVRLTAREAYEIALAHATAKYGDVYLSEIRAGYATIIRGRPRNVAGGRSEEWSVSFRKLGEENQWVGILVTVKNGDVTHSAEGKPYPLRGTWADYVRNSTIDVNKWKISSPEAVRIAEEAGGAEFRLLMLVLAPHWQGPYWYLVFGPATTEKGKHPGLSLRINAADGEVISTRTKTFEIY